MRYKITLKPKGPFIVGGKRLSSEYINSLNYVPGGVLRAALSKEITARCPYYEENGDKKYWVQYKNQEYCSSCDVKNLCKDFSEVKIGHSYPEGAEIYPLTAMCCKEEPEHGAFDILAYRIAMKIGKKYKVKIKGSDLNCPICDKRSERYSGMYIRKSKKLEDVEVIKALATKNSINPNTRTARDGILYTLDTVSNEVLIGSEIKNLELKGYVEGENLIESFQSIDDLYVGAYTTVGFGKMVLDIEEEKEETIEDIKKRIEKFNMSIRDRILENSQLEDKVYVPITLVSDSYLDIENYYDKELNEISTKEFINIYEEKVEELRELGELFYIVISNEMKRGFDTSNNGVILRNAKKVIKAGGIFVLEISKEKIDYEKLLMLQKSGIGSNKNHGFGQVSICNKFHVENIR